MEQKFAKEIENLRHLLFANFQITPHRAKLFLEDMRNNPEKIPNYNQLLLDNMMKQYDTIKSKPLDEINAMAKERVSEWTSTIGPVTTQEFVAMSKQWNIPIDAFIDKVITPELIKEMLDCFVVGQEKYKIMLAVSFFIYKMTNKYSGIFFPKSNLLVGGPSGSGKTYGMQVLTKLFHVPFIVIHCNSLVQEGIIGSTASDGFTSLLTQGWTKEDIEKAVVCFDEFDKLFETKGGVESGTYNARIVNELLNIIDDNGEVEFKTSYEKTNDNRIRIPTRKMMFVFTGVFDGLKEKGNYEERNIKRNKPIGFMSTQTPADEMQNICLDDEPTTEDFVEYGVKPEIIGRISNFVFINELTEEQMVSLFDLGPNSPFNDFEQYFNKNGINAILTDEGKHVLAKLARERKLGVRGLKSLLQQVLLEDMYDLDVGQEKILMVTKQYIIDNLKNKFNSNDETEKT